MRVEVDFEGGKNAAGIYVHKKLPEAMGNSVAAFAHAVLSGHTQAGVWYPEEKEALAVSTAQWLVPPDWHQPLLLITGNTCQLTKLSAVVLSRPTQRLNQGMAVCLYPQTPMLFAEDFIVRPKAGADLCCCFMDNVLLVLTLLFVCACCCSCRTAARSCSMLPRVACVLTSTGQPGP